MELIFGIFTGRDAGKADGHTLAVSILSLGVLSCKNIPKQFKIVRSSCCAEYQEILNILPKPPPGWCQSPLLTGFPKWCKNKLILLALYGVLILFSAVLRMRCCLLHIVWSVWMQLLSGKAYWSYHFLDINGCKNLHASWAEHNRVILHFCRDF